jgi:hypothetical protein
VWLVNW